MMKQASVPLYIRFGEIPKDGKSKVHRGDDTIREEGGISVWRAVENCGCYYPLLPQEPNENTITDYYHFLLDSKSNVYLVTGTELCVEGSDREPLLMDVTVLKDITHYYRHTKENMEQITIFCKKFMNSCRIELQNRLLKHFHTSESYNHDVLSLLKDVIMEETSKLRYDFKASDSDSSTVTTGDNYKTPIASNHPTCETSKPVTDDTEEESEEWKEENGVRVMCRKHPCGTEQIFDFSTIISSLSRSNKAEMEQLKVPATILRYLVTIYHGLPCLPYDSAQNKEDMMGFIKKYSDDTLYYKWLRKAIRNQYIRTIAGMFVNVSNETINKNYPWLLAPAIEWDTASLSKNLSGSMINLIHDMNRYGRHLSKQERERQKRNDLITELNDEVQDILRDAQYKLLCPEVIFDVYQKFCKIREAYPWYQFSPDALQSLNNMDTQWMVQSLQPSLINIEKLKWYKNIGTLTGSEVE